MQPGEGQTGHSINGDVTAAVLDAIRSVRYGSVEIVIHDGRVVGIERREKVRIEGNSGR
jgi:hypothetical protein